MEERQPATPTWDATQVRILDAADELLIRRGVHGVTIAELSRRSGLSRPTLYRHWNDADDVVRSALLRRVAVILESFPEPADRRSDLVDDVLRFSALFHADPVYAHLLADEPEAFTRYTLQRVGSSQTMILAWLAASITAAQRGGSVRHGDARAIAVMTLLIAQSAVLSQGTVAALIDDETWESELRAALDGHLRP